ncbi:MAG TPA: hypothetical protein VMU84_20095 [Thermoanaerobaculia bacterium]|nr:hypothetical protein [Thermoanaerobaculia bacterium]
MRKLGWLLVLCASFVYAEEKTPQQLFVDARAAYDKKDFAAYLQTMDALTKLRPGHPIVLFNHAGALALNDKAAESVAELDRLARMQIAMDLSDHDLDSLRARDDFHAVEKSMSELRKQRISTSSVAFRIPHKDLITESIVYDAKTRSFFISAVHKRKILRRDARGKLHDFITDGIWGANGLGIDDKRRILYASSSAYDSVEGFVATQGNQAALFAFNADTGALLAKYDAPKGTFCDDLTVAPDGTVYVSDSTGSVLRLQPDAKELDTFVAKGAMRSPQGSAFGNGALYVADYGGAIWSVDPKTATVTRVQEPTDLAMIGIDGLEYHDGTLIGIQNGIEPARVVRFWLDGNRITRSQILEMNHPMMSEPTIGVVVGSDFYFLAASQNRTVVANEVEKLHDAVVLKIHL